MDTGMPRVRYLRPRASRYDDIMTSVRSRRFKAVHTFLTYVTYYLYSRGGFGGWHCYGFHEPTSLTLPFVKITGIQDLLPISGKLLSGVSSFNRVLSNYFEIARSSSLR